MRGYDRDEYEDLDEYEEDGYEEDGYEEKGGEQEYEDEYEEEETRQPTQEELEYLELRQKLKESYRKQMKKESGSANSSLRDKTNALRKDNFGSFFGPSQPVIAQRVIQESKSLLENPNFTAKLSNPTHAKAKASASTPMASKPRAGHPSKVKNVTKTKAEMLKNTRDYSFLLSDDAEVPSSMKNPPVKNAFAPNSDSRSAQVPRSKQSVNNGGRQALNGREARKPAATGSQIKPKAGYEKLSSSNKLPVDPRKQLGSNNGNGPGRPLASRGAPSRVPRATTEKRVSAPIAQSSKLGVHKQAAPAAGKSSMQSAQKHVSAPVAKNTLPGAQRPSSSHRPSSVSKKPLVQRKESQETVKPRIAPKQPISSSRPQPKQPQSRPPARPSLGDERLKRKPLRRDDEDSDDGEKAISMIRKMFGYNPNRYRDEGDDSDMEANFDDIMREERRSAKIAKKEDEEQLRLIQEEERREKMRLAKKRKLSH